MVSNDKLAQVVKDLHQKVAQLKREKQEQLEAFAKQDAQKQTSRDWLWRRCSAWLSTSRVRQYEKVARVVTERG
jgi:hypothetical protein